MEDWKDTYLSECLDGIKQSGGWMLMGVDRDSNLLDAWIVGLDTDTGKKFQEVSDELCARKV